MVPRQAHARPLRPTNYRPTGCKKAPSAANLSAMPVTLLSWSGYVQFSPIDPLPISTPLYSIMVNCTYILGRVQSSAGDPVPIAHHPFQERVTRSLGEGAGNLARVTRSQFHLHCMRSWSSAHTSSDTCNFARVTRGQLHIAPFQERVTRSRDVSRASCRAGDPLAAPFPGHRHRVTRLRGRSLRRLSGRAGPPRATAVATSGTDLARRPRAPTSRTDLEHRPRAPTSGTDLGHRPRAPTSRTDLEHRPRAPTSRTDLAHRPSSSDIAHRPSSSDIAHRPQ